MFISRYITSLNRGGTYIGSADLIKNNETINLINKYNDKCFQYTATVALNHKEIGKKLERS